MSDDESDGAPLDDRLLDGLSGLEFLLSASLMPDDFDLEALASCDASAIAQCEACPDIQDRVFVYHPLDTTMAFIYCNISSFAIAGLPTHSTHCTYYGRLELFL